MEVRCPAKPEFVDDEVAQFEIALLMEELSDRCGSCPGT